MAHMRMDETTITLTDAEATLMRVLGVDYEDLLDPDLPATACLDEQGVISSMTGRGCKTTYSDGDYF